MEASTTAVGRGFWDPPDTLWGSCGHQDSKTRLPLGQRHMILGVAAPGSPWPARRHPGLSLGARTPITPFSTHQFLGASYDTSSSRAPSTFFGIAVIPLGEASALDSSLQGGRLLGSCPPPLRSLPGLVITGRWRPPSTQTEHRPLYPPRLWSPHPVSLHPGSGFCVLWVGMGHFPERNVTSVGLEALVDLFICVSSVPGIQGCQIVFWGVTALQVTQRQPGDACGPSRLN